MTTRAIRRKVRRQADESAPAGNHCRALVPADGTAIRKKIKAAYEKARREVDQSQRVLDQFQQQDQPQFTRWLNSHFGATLTELRELAAKLSADEALVMMVEDEVMFNGVSYARAYQRVTAPPPEQPESPPPPPPGGAGQGERGGRRNPFENPFGPEAGWDDPNDPEDPLNAFFEQLFGEGGPGRRPGGRPGNAPGESALGADAPPPPTAQRLKELYRTLVRLLHPDSQREMTPQKTEWWHQAQAAYEAGDVAQLEVILTLCEIGESGTTAHTSASLLQRITAQLKSSLRELKRQLTERRREPAWNFSTRPDRHVLADQVRRQLTADLTLMRQRSQEMQRLIADWKAAAERLKPERKRKTKPRDSEFLF